MYIMQLHLNSLDDIKSSITKIHQQLKKRGHLLVILQSLRNYPLPFLGINCQFTIAMLQNF